MLLIDRYQLMFYEVNESLRIGTDSTTCLQRLFDCSLERFKLKSNYNRRVVRITISFCLAFFIILCE